MKTLSRNQIVAAFGIALLVLAGLLLFQSAHRKNAAKSARFSEQYLRVIKQLNGDMDSVRKKMRRNEAVIPVIVVASREPVPGRKIVEKNRAFVLQGISWSADRPLVMIDDQLYKQGDQVGGYTIQEILPQAVILRDADGAQKTITLNKEAQP